MKNSIIRSIIMCSFICLVSTGHAQVIYQTTFDDVFELNNCSFSSGQWDIVDGVLKNTVPGAVYIDLTAVTLPSEFCIEFDTKIEVDGLHPCCVISFYLPWSNHFRPTAEGGDPPARFAVHNKTDGDCVAADEKFFAHIDPNEWHHFTVLREEISREVEIPPSPITVGAYNIAVLVRDAGNAVNYGLEQRDAAIMIGAIGATTLIYMMGGLEMPGAKEDVLKELPSVRNILISELKPRENDVIVIGSADDKRLAELGAKSAVYELLKVRLRSSAG